MPYDEYLGERITRIMDDSKKPFVEVETADQKFERKDVELGVSDGIFVEVKSGIAATDKIKVWNALAEE